MKRNDKQRLFEVMGRLDKTFKPKLNEGFEEIEATDDVALPAETGEETTEQTPEEKLQELTAKVDELYAMLHGEAEEDEVPAETGEVAPENLQEWNFDKGKGAKKFEKKEDKESEEHEESESHEEEEKEHKEKKELDEVKPNTGKKVPVAAIAKVGK